MNTLTRTLAALDPELDAPTEITAADEDLLRVIMAQPLPLPPRPTRTYVRRTLVLAGALAASIALGVTTIDLGDREIGAPSAAASVLERAADVTIATSDPVVGPGQYLRITTIERGWVSPMDLTDLGSDGKPVYWERLRTQHTWVPYDRDDLWIFDEESVVTDRVSTDAPRPGTDEPHHTWSAAGGRSTNWHEHTRYEDADWYASLPRDPTRLLAQLLDEGHDYAPVEHHVALDEAVTPILTSGLAPADIRAALFRALADEPQVRIVDGITHVDGRAAIALHMGYAQELLFDRATGQYIGNQSRGTDFPILPQVGPEDPSSTTIVRTDVVDKAPATG